MHSSTVIAAVAILISGVSCCGPFPDPRSLFAGDLQSPLYLGARCISESVVAIDFQEAVVPDPESFLCLPDIPVAATKSDAGTVSVDLALPMAPGAEYTIHGRVVDLAGNSLQFITKLYGFNPSVPRLSINEFTTQGSGKRPDCVELVALTGGNLAGVTVCEGVDDDFADRIVLPPVEIVAGEYLVIHFKPQGIPEEIDETGSLDESLGYDATDTARDFWVPGGDGLSGNNGVISVYDAPGGNIIDAVLYSNRTSESDENYGGFGSARMQRQAELLVGTGAWEATDRTVRPEDAVNPDGATATRSICRRAGEDTDTADDWYIVPTRGVSFGSANSTEVYTP
jgi:hypothetical protein